MADAPPVCDFAGRYALHEAVGHGGHASIYRATDRRRGRVVAVKRYDTRVHRDVGFVAGFRRTARQAQQLDHPAVLRTWSYGYAGGTYYLVADYVAGGSLQHVRPAADEEGWTALVPNVLAACDGLDYLHRLGLSHGNLKPSNILLRGDGDAVVADVGGLRHLGSSGLTMTDAVLDAVAYYSPEHVTGAALTAASDVYALGVMLYELCLGRLPFEDANPLTLAYRHVHDEPPAPRSIDPDLGVDLEALIMRCLAKDPPARYTSARALGEALAACPGRNALRAAPERLDSVATLVEQRLRAQLEALKERVMRRLPARQGPDE